MKKLIISLVLLAYGTAALALNTIIVNKTPHEAELMTYTSQDQVIYCGGKNVINHGVYTKKCHQGKIILQSGEGFVLSNDIYLDSVVLKTNNRKYLGNAYDNQAHHYIDHWEYEKFEFEVRKWLFPHNKLRENRRDSHSMDLVPSGEKYEHVVIINLQLLQSTPYGFQVLYLEEPRLFQDRNNQSDPTKPMIFSYQNQNNYGNSYGNAYSNCHGDEYECGNRHIKYAY